MKRTLFVCALGVVSAVFAVVSAAAAEPLIDQRFEDRPRQVRIDASFVEFPIADVEPLVRDRRVNVDTLKELWRNGRGKLLAAPSVTTKAGQEAVAKSVTEVIYPTDFTGGLPSASTNEPVRTNLPACWAIVPGGFETREVGAILQVVPEFQSGAGSMINLTLNPQVVRPPEWKAYDVSMAGPDGKVMRAKGEQPRFSVISVSTSVTVRNGTTVLLGGGATDGKNDTSVYIFVTATILDPADQPVARPDR